jgi:hypothetical protein
MVESPPRIIATIASLNIATSNRDEKDCPLFKRLPYIEQLINNPWFDIFCVQEVRPTGSMSAFDVILTLRMFLGPHWEFYDQTVNPSQKACHRTIFWNSKKWRHHHTDVLYTTPPQPTQGLVFGSPPQALGQSFLPHYIPYQSVFPPRPYLPNIGSSSYFPFLITKTWFIPVGSATNVPKFNVVNAHAPMQRSDRISYWKQVRACMDPNTVIIGDLNKFDQDREIFDRIFRFPVKDLIDADTETFVSFQTDRQPPLAGEDVGELWHSSLDSAVLDTTYLQGNAEVISTEEPPRASDHFLVTARVAWAF